MRTGKKQVLRDKEGNEIESWYLAKGSRKMKRDSDEAYRKIMKDHGLRVGYGKRQSISNGKMRKKYDN